MVGLGCGDLIVLRGLCPHEFIKPTGDLLSPECILLSTSPAGMLMLIGTISVAQNCVGNEDLIQCARWIRQAQRDGIASQKGPQWNSETTLHGIIATAREEWLPSLAHAVWHMRSPLDVVVVLLERARRRGVINFPHSPWRCCWLAV